MPKICIKFFLQHLMSYSDSNELRMREKPQLQKKTWVDPYPCQLIISIMESEHEKKKSQRGGVTAMLSGSSYRVWLNRKIINEAV